MNKKTKKLITTSIAIVTFLIIAIVLQGYAFALERYELKADKGIYECVIKGTFIEKVRAYHYRNFVPQTPIQAI